jgi:hypothetical protein
MQSAANFMAGFLSYNSCTMSIHSRRARRASGWRGGLVLGLLLLAAALHPGTGARADEPKPAPSPPPQDNPGSPQGAPGAPAEAESKPGPAAQEGKTGRSVFGTIVGAIYDTKKKPLTGWMVQLSTRGQGGLLRVTGTNEKGQYVFKDLPAGTYDIEVGTGDETARKKGRIEVRPPFRNFVDFEVGPHQDDTTNTLAGLVASKKAAEAAVAGPAQGAPAVSVPFRGTFADAEKRPVSDVPVTIVALDGSGIFQAFSGDDGSFALAAVPPGRYRVLVASPGYVPIDLKSVEVSPVSGLNLSLSLVDYPLNTKASPEERLPREEPRPAPRPSPSAQPS